MESELPILDRSILRESLGDDQELIDEIYQLFVTTAPEIMESLLKAVKDEDLETVKNRAHSLKGSAGNIGALAMQESMRQVENACRAQDSDRLAMTVNEAKTCYSDIMQELKPGGTG